MAWRGMVFQRQMVASQGAQRKNGPKVLQIDTKSVEKKRNGELQKKKKKTQCKEKLLVCVGFGDKMLCSGGEGRELQHSKQNTPTQFKSKGTPRITCRHKCFVSPFMNE